MTKDKKKEEKAEIKDEMEKPNFKMSGLYIKDLSFENPGAPMALLQAANKPRINVGVDVFINNLKDTAFEVAVKVTAKTTTEEGKTLFIAEVLYGGVFVINPEIPKENFERILFVDCAQVIFPFARRIIADLTTEGGFPPVLLEPINLENIYKTKRSAKPAA